MERESDSPCRSRTYPRQCSGWELEFRDCGAIPRQGCCWWRRDGSKGYEGGDGGGKSLWRKAGSHRNEAICWVTHRGWSHHHKLSPPTHQHWQLNKERLAHQEPIKGLPTWGRELQSRTPQLGPLYVPDPLIYRAGPQPGCPSMCLNRWSYGERLSKEASW